MSNGVLDEVQVIPPAEVEEVDLYHAKSWITKYVFSQDAKVIAIQYAGTAIAIGLVALVLSWLMRLQLGFPDYFSFIDPEDYYQYVTMHGMIMVIYLLTALFLGGFGNYLIPLMVGARDMVFPYMNMLSYWVYLIAVLVLTASFFVPGGPTGAGWTLYPPQAISEGTPGIEYGIMLMLVSLILFIIGFTMGGLNYVVTALQARTRGMTLMRMPLTVWGIFTATILALLAFPALFVAGVMMALDRAIGTSFFMPEMISGGEMLAHNNGSPLLFQHLFWFFGHPEVYILILPAMGIASEVLSNRARKPIFGYHSMVLAIIGIGFLGWIVWGHHMFMSGMNPLLGTSFMISTMAIAVPSAIKTFNWMATVWKGDIHLDSPMLYALAFVSMFIIGGLSGIFMASTPVDIYIHDTYFIVAHIHYVLFGGSLFAIFAGITFWYPKMFGRMMNESLNKLHFGLTIVLYNLVFWPMHNLGLQGMMRRIYDFTQYEYLAPLQPMNEFISISVFLLVATQSIYAFNFFWSLFKGEKASDNPWDSNTLEWTVPSPPPHGNFPEMPVVYRGPYEYSSPESETDFYPQTTPPSKPPVQDLIPEPVTPTPEGF